MKQISPATAQRAGFALLILIFPFFSIPAEENREGAVEVQVLNVGFDRLANSPVVVLQDKGKKKALPIWVGPSEAQSIAMEMQGMTSPRPLTHDLLKNILKELNVGFEKAIVSNLKNETYFAHIYLVSAGRHIEVDSRPSDAIALALRFHKPIFVAKTLMEGKNSIDLSHAEGSITSDKVRGISVQEITERLADYFGFQSKEGVLVSEVNAEVEAAGLRSGDVIVAVDSENVHGVADFKEKVSKREGQRIPLTVRREGKVITMNLPPDR
jgi:uncharacterized protein